MHPNLEMSVLDDLGEEMTGVALPVSICMAAGVPDGVDRLHVASRNQSRRQGFRGGCFRFPPALLTMDPGTLVPSPPVLWTPAPSCPPPPVTVDPGTLVTPVSTNSRSRMVAITSRDITLR